MVQGKGWMKWKNAATILIGKLIFGDLGVGLLLLVIAAVAFAWIARSFRSETAPPDRAVQVPERERVAAD